MEQTTKRQHGRLHPACPILSVTVLLVVGAASSQPCDLSSGALTAGYLRCEYSVEPLGVDVPHPRLSWELAVARSADGSWPRGQRQTAYQVCVASSEALLREGCPELWDSGKVVSGDTIQVVYAGRELASAQRYWWRVRVWDQDDRPSAWSASATWTMGLLKPADWQAQWIGVVDRVGPSERKGIGYHAAEARSVDETKWVQVDLGRPVDIERVALWPVRNHGGAVTFGFPVRFRVEATDDPNGGRYSVLADESGGDAVCPREGAVVIPCAGVKARYVRVTATRLWPRADGVGCFALAELEVDAAGRNMARDAPVVAADTVEQWGWAQAALTDGVRGAEPSTLRLRREFQVEQAVTRATAFVCGLGQYELTIDGRKVGDAWLTPGWTQYGRTSLYDTYDVTGLLTTGAHCLGLYLGNGMYNMEDDARGAQQQRSSGALKVICQIEMETADGTRMRIKTDASWQAAPGPTTYSGVFGGEDYDARREQPGWDQPGCVAAGWQPALVVRGPGGRLAGLSQSAPPLVVSAVRTPVKRAEPKPNVVVYDLGQNAPYIPRVTVDGVAGTTVRLWPAELLKPDGTVDQTSIRPGKLVSYTLRGGGTETWWPRFYYVGSRYWQGGGTGADGRPVPVAPVVQRLEGLLVHSAAPPVGEFACSDELFNRTRDLIVWAMRSNLASVITDCPHREKSGWLEQIHLNAPGLLYSFDLVGLFRKTLADMADAQQSNGMVPTMAPEYFIYEGGFRDSVEWGGACVYLPGYLARWYGDTTSIERYYDTMRRYVDYLGTRAQDHILSCGLGDWNGYGPDPRTPVALTDTAYYYLAVRTLAEFAGTLGKAAEQQRLQELGAAIRAAFNRAHFDAATGKYAGGAQSCQATALDLGLVPAGYEAAVLAQLVADVEAQDYAVSCGEVGHPSLLRVLAAQGRADLIYRMHHQSRRPGYGYQLARGATTLTEAWDASPISQNHFMLGHVLEWFYGGLAGIQPDPAGVAFGRILIRPEPVAGVTAARATYRSVRGLIGSDWRQDEGRFTLQVTIPPNCTATVAVPGTRLEDVQEGGRAAEGAAGVQFLRCEAGRVLFRVDSGRYTFVVARADAR
jgi:alpha-L-rhamnosidase